MHACTRSAGVAEAGGSLNLLAGQSRQIGTLQGEELSQRKRGKVIEKDTWC